MFSKNRVNETPPKTVETDPQPAQVAASAGQSSATKPAMKPKPAASVLSSDLTITGNIRTSGDIQVEGQIEGDIYAHLLTVGETATVRGEVVADDIVVNGHVIGRVRGLKVRLTSTAKVEGDIIHKTIAIESGAHFEGSVQRQEDPLKTSGGDARKPAALPEPTATELSKDS
ncbi:polymer-forming cytoskeletal protein [Pseudoruegeria sp. SK021]|uniref:bactofilin family protein n=1 Tax=Pseudoruegeria sp. SK021 TaxID=1933035 RepID=UPI000A24E8AC|nr:polymer-forming cytoskeletal protein [Pseudoruegeria sp. SK021]OSP56235.1 cell shape determination protein CcmA [Pseudoruegeria sp. SK021]